MLVFFTWVVRGVADSVSMWDAVERITSFCKNIPEESSIASNLQTVSDRVQVGARVGQSYRWVGVMAGEDCQGGIRAMVGSREGG